MTQGANGLHIMGPGGLKKDPSEFLAEPRVSDAISALRKSFDVILIDSPPLELWTDALSFSRVADAVILVARVGKITSEAHEHSIESHVRAGANISGTVVTGVRVPSVRRSRVIFSRRRTTAVRTP